RAVSPDNTRATTSSSLSSDWAAAAIMGLVVTAYLRVHRNRETILFKVTSILGFIWRQKGHLPGGKRLRNCLSGRGQQTGKGLRRCNSLGRGMITPWPQIFLLQWWKSRPILQSRAAGTVSN